MFPTHKRFFHFHANGNMIRTTADHPLYVEGQGWTDVADLQQGDKLRSHDGDYILIDAISNRPPCIRCNRA